ncbi:NAD(P)H-binding protein [Pseudenhygromyxa sp. WMMC2535]|uniref:NAD-dependent epimerase/dehydratase family protein n=1 Tax=Pseudenhygromyxa sp. WMMC2535 TaxID=2712867 RepID=UPI001553D74A|nr:NAD-dependent epimerase/dehydratase family protein [Pseudenhygromyxa sp. WMMC2535]NVB38513.1 NAD(P)H-binding protein [Pseudenhygromyxa sp. WMMC2535]
MGRSIALAGGTGFIGRHVAARLVAAGHRVVAVARGVARSSSTDSETTEVELRRCDLSQASVAEIAAALAGCDALVNLVGIKREEPGGLSFEQAHVALPQRLAAAARAAGISRLIHVSVAGARAHPRSAYLDSKARGEQAVLAEGLALDDPSVTVLRPGVVYGRGDDLLRNLADGVRSAPIFPGPDGGRAELAPVAVEDVAEAVARCLEGEREAALRGAVIDVVGPARLSLRALVHEVAAAPSVARPCLVAPVPAALLRPAAALLERLSADPLLTPSQLVLLREGVVGDPEPARRLLDLETRPLSAAAIDAALADFRPRLPSLRLLPDPRASAELHAQVTRTTADFGPVPSSGRLLAFAAIAVAAMLLAPRWIPSVWTRMAALEVTLSILALLTLDLRWGALWRPKPARLAWGLGAALIMWAGALGVGAALAALAPALWSQAAALYDWADALPLAASAALLAVIVAGEELVWRGALGLALVPRLGPWGATLTSAALFTLAHLSSGPPLLALAAALAGGAWTALAIRSRSLIAPFSCHLIWDAALLWLTPMRGF